MGPHHPDVALSLGNLASFYDDQGRYAEAEPFYKRALAIREQVLGPHHPKTARILSNLAMHYVRKRNYKRAEPLLKRALRICEQKLEPGHPTTISVLRNYLSFLWATKQKEEAAAVESRIKNAQSRNSNKSV